MRAGKPETALVDETLVQSNLGDNPKHIAIAKRAAQESVVMLANKDATLPLDRSKIKKLLVLGTLSVCMVFLPFLIELHGRLFMDEMIRQRSTV